MPFFSKKKKAQGEEGEAGTSSSEPEKTAAASTMPSAAAPAADADDTDPPPAKAKTETDPEAEPEPEPEPLAPTGTTTSQNTIVYPEGARLALIMTSLYISVFLIALDRLIISTAIPEITNEFHSVTDIGWYGSGYLLTNCAFQLLYGKVYTFFSIKATFLTSVVLFEVGSAVCGAAPSSVAFIVGRAIAGLGAAGIMAGGFVVIVYAVPLHKRPLYQGLFGAVFGVSSVIGPLIGGAFTSNVTWRWCFYINLPFGGVTLLFVGLLLKVPDREETKLPLTQKILQLDLLGTAALLPGTICLLLALQWGGSEYPWSAGRIIALLVVASVLLVVFCLIQVYMPKTATIAPHIFKQRSILAGVWATICFGSSMMIIVYFVPVWFQAIRGESALDSGIRLLPLCLPMVAASIATGVLTSKIGYYTPFLLVGTVFMSIGAGLLTTFQVDTSDAKSVGYQILYGWGLGMGMQAPNLAAQTVLSRKDSAVGLTLIIFTQLLGGAVFLSVGQNVLNSQLLERLSHLQGFDPRLLQTNGATTLIQVLPESVRPAVLEAYNEALRRVLLVALVLACLTVLGALAMEWKSVRKDLPDAKKAAEKGDGKQAEEGGNKGWEETGEDGIEQEKKDETTEKTK
ncbi:major facilitator superfamily domain-containing protein [Echria macrotheca]|uniref:Major facilitator superfamily domain-containing protein n=1 Tax=Echria macrotheca TaxID=438768 RepID=A0AAJ0FFY3_9PEZI|nr:major facilitator superfamily domain-containing protein [Echria macrotheca]